MGRRRTKDDDLKPGWRRINGRLYYQPTTQGERDKRRMTAFEIPDGPMIYFIRAKNGAVKVGFTASKRNLTHRVANLRVGSPAELTLLGAVPGSIEDEARAHDALRLWKRSGEWFGPSRAVTAYVRHALIGRCVPPELRRVEKMSEAPAPEPR